MYGVIKYRGHAQTRMVWATWGPMAEVGIRCLRFRVSGVGSRIFESRFRVPRIKGVCLRDPNNKDYSKYA